MVESDFVSRHIGSREEEIPLMLELIGVSSVDELIEQTIPASIRAKNKLGVAPGIPENKFLEKIKGLAAKNKLYKTYIGMGYYNTSTPSVIVRNVVENPVWYTSYTPYQAEISQGRLEALLNFQTMVMELTAMDIANASLLDEATAAAEAMVMMFNTQHREAGKDSAVKCLVDSSIWPQTRAVLDTRALPLGIELEYVPFEKMGFNSDDSFGVILQYPDGNGDVKDYSSFVEKIHNLGGKVAVATDLLALTVLVPPGEWGADIVFGSSQRFGVPMAYGGPHAAFFATRDELKRGIPGRIIGVTRDANGKRALRMALQTREQHIKREKATSNICTAQALLANMAGFFAVYHGPEGLVAIGKRVHGLTVRLATALESLGFTRVNKTFFDTIRISLPIGISTDQIREQATRDEINLFYDGTRGCGLSIDETTTLEDVNRLIELFAGLAGKQAHAISSSDDFCIPAKLSRASPFMQQPVFKMYRSETEMTRYIKRLERKDISLTHSMISLGSCTMKLNAATTMFPITWPEFASIHPFVPLDQAEGYHQMMNELKADLAEITGFAGVSLQPNSGAAGEYAGLMVIRAYHQGRHEEHRNVALIPSSAHGTNPASAVMAGLKVVVVKCDERGNIDLEDLRERAVQYKNTLACLMITYPSTHGVFEEHIRDICIIIHDNGGQVYMDGANMNAQVGLTNPAIIGADVCHLNLHKTFAIPHGGGGPGVGPIGVASHLVNFLPGHPFIENYHAGIMAVSSAPWGSAGILPITYAYMKLMGGEGLTRATKMAILNANYLASALKKGYGVLYTGKNGRVAHEMILECRHLKALSGISETDIAKRLMDYGYHAPTLSFPVPGTLMIEPTESESKAELDRFLEAMKLIYNEIIEVETGVADRDDNVLKQAPHPEYVIVSDKWTHLYSREKAAYPVDWVRDNKFWVPVARVDNAYGDRNLVCSCEPVSGYA